MALSQEVHFKFCGLPKPLRLLQTVPHLAGSRGADSALRGDLALPANC